jgi:hypothetical protein
MDTITVEEKPADLIERYVDLRDARTAADATFAAFRKEEYDEPMHNIEMKLLDLLNQMGTESIRAKTGTAYKKASVSITTADGSAWRRHVIGLEAWELVTFTPAKTAINDLIAAGGELPPGLNRSVFYNVHINRPKEKE